MAQITLNIHYTLPKHLWKELNPLLDELKDNGIMMSVEPGGFQMYTEDDIPQNVWDTQIDSFCKKAAEILGYPVGDACGDFPCVPYE